MPKILPWSHSALAGVATCPRQHEEVKVLKHYADQKNEAALWGDRFHKVAERHIGYGEPLPPEFEHYRAYFAQFLDRVGETTTERKYAITKALQPCDFFAPTVWGRGILDVLTLRGAVALCDDHKTGKNRKKDMQQLRIAALLVFYHHPEIDTVHTAFHWVQYGFGPDARDTETFTRAQIPDMWAKTLPALQEYARCFQSGVFPPRPSGLCAKYCPVSSCEYYGKGRR